MDESKGEVGRVHAGSRRRRRRRRRRAAPTPGVEAKSRRLATEVRRVDKGGMTFTHKHTNTQCTHTILKQTQKHRKMSELSNFQIDYIGHIGISARPEIRKQKIGTIWLDA